MPPRKQKPNAKATAAKAGAVAEDNADLDALLAAAIRENEAVSGSPAALRLEQEQREARENIAVLLPAGSPAALRFELMHREARKNVAPLLAAVMRENDVVSGSPAALRLEQEQREAKKKVEQEQFEAREKSWRDGLLPRIAMVDLLMAEKKKREVQEQAAAEPHVVQFMCEKCGTGQSKMKCGGCATVQYCSKQCQVAHWPAHKARCRVLKAVQRERQEEQGKAEQTVLHNPDTEAGNCWTCGADNPRNVCNRCKVTKYCGMACQTENWPIHKGRCADLKSQYSRIDAAKSVLKKVKAGTRRSQMKLDKSLGVASMLGRIVDIERIIAAGGRVNTPTGWCPLHWAAMEGHARAIGVLVRHGAQVNARDEDGVVAIHFASRKGHVKAVAALLEHGAQIDSRDNDGCSALFVASRRNHSEIVALLLDKGAQVDFANKKGETALMESARNGHVAMVRLLLEHGALIDSRDNDGRSPLYWASCDNHLEVVALLLQKGAQVDLANEICL